MQSNDQNVNYLKGDLCLQLMNFIFILHFLHRNASGSAREEDPITGVEQNDDVNRDVIQEEPESEDEVILLDPATPRKAQSTQKESPAKDHRNPEHFPQRRNLVSSLEEIDPAGGSSMRKETDKSDHEKRKNLGNNSETQQTSKEDDRRKRNSEVENAVVNRNSDERERLGGGDAPGHGNEQGDVCLVSPEGQDSSKPVSESKKSKNKKRLRSSRRRSLPVQSNKTRTDVDTQTEPRELALSQGNEGDGVLRGIAGDKEPIMPEGCSEEVTITRIRRDCTTEDENGKDKETGQAKSSQPVQELEGASEQRLRGSAETLGGARNNGHIHLQETVGNNEDVHNVPSLSLQVPRRNAKRSSEAMSSPDTQQRLKRSKRQCVDANTTETDEVFVDSIVVGVDASAQAESAVGESGHFGRPKRKSRRSHGEAPPCKVRGKSVVGESVDPQNASPSTVASPCIRDPQPRIPTPLENTFSSDDFQPVKIPTTRKSRSSGRSIKQLDKSQETATPTTEGSPIRVNRRSSSRTKASTNQHSAAESGASDEDFQTPRKTTRNKSKEISANRRRSPRSKHKANTLDEAEDNRTLESPSVDLICVPKEKHLDNEANPVTDKSEQNPIVDNTPEGAYGENNVERTGNNHGTNSSQCGTNILPNEQRLAIEVTESTAIGDHHVNNEGGNAGKETNPKNNEHQVDGPATQEQQSLEIMFRSDLGVEESSFLGFSQEDINEAISLRESFRQERHQEEEEGLEIQDLEKAALNVYCMPSSDPVAEDDDKSSVGSFGEFTIGLVLQKVENFPSEGSEWEEQVTGFMQKLDTQLEIKRRRESELSTLPSPTFHKSIFDKQLQNMDSLHPVVEDLGPEPLSDDDSDVFADEGPKENIPLPNGDVPHGRRRSARINQPDARPVTRAAPSSNRSYSGMCVSPKKKRKNVCGNKQKNSSQADAAKSTEAKQALRELSSNQLLHSPEHKNLLVTVSTPKQTRRKLLGNHASPKLQHIALPPGTPREEQQIITNNYVHDDSESEVVFPKFSSPQKGSILSPVKHRVKRKRFKHRRFSEPCCPGHRDVQSSPIRPSHRSNLLPFGLASSRKALFMKGKVKHVNIASPRKRSKSVSHSSSKPSSFLTFLNELKAGLSPTFYTFKKPHFSLRILQPAALKRHHCRSKMSRSLLALNLSLPSDFDLRIYEFHDDDSTCDEDLVISPITSDTTRAEVVDRCTQTPPSSTRRKRFRPRRLSVGSKRAASGQIDTGHGERVEVEHTTEGKGKRSVQIQATSPDIDTIFDMPLDYYL